MGYIPPKKITEEEREYDRDWVNQHDIVDVPIKDYRGFRIERQVYFKEGYHERNVNLEPKEPKEKKERKPRGQNGITSDNRRSVRNRAFLLQKKYGKKRLGFLTLTLPSLRLDKLWVIATEWSELLRQFGQEIKRAIERKGRKFIWVGVTEIQTKRLKNRQEPALHIHIVFVSHDGDRNWYITANEVRQIWARLIGNILNEYMPHENHEVDTKAAVDLQSVKKDAARYLSKYMTKNKDVVDEMIELDFEDCIPSSWVHGCNNLKKAAKELITQVPSDIKNSIQQGVDLVARGVMIYLHEIKRDDKLYGWVGKLAEEWRKKLCTVEFEI